MKYYKFMLWKAYFEKGYGISSPIKWFMAVLGVKLQNISIIAIGAIVYAFICLFVGWAWYHYNLIVAEHEVNNQFNLFMRELRSDRTKRKI